jgi:hypothetical protein
MDMIKIHEDAKKDPSTFYHEFLISYHKNAKKIVYGFTEGYEDLSFYTGFIQQNIFSPWRFDVKPVGNRNNVLKLYSFFDWDQFSKKQIAFFIDRDLSMFLGETPHNESNIYISDDYSIENCIVNRLTCRRILREIYNLSILPDADENKILNCFEDQLKIFLQEMILTMAWIIYWKRTGKKTSKKSLDRIEMKKMFSFNKGRIQKILKPNNTNSVEEYIHIQCNVPFDPTYDISSIISELETDEIYLRFIRGKYVLWFLIAFTFNIHHDIKKVSTEKIDPPKTHLNLTLANGVTIIGPRACIPETLRNFLESTHNSYIREIECES